jgi:hypothetical protein
MPYISAIERMGEARGKVDPIGLLLVYRVGKFQWKLLKKLKTTVRVALLQANRAVGSTRSRLDEFYEYHRSD